MTREHARNLCYYARRVAGEVAWLSPDVFLLLTLVELAEAELDAAGPEPAHPGVPGGSASATTGAPSCAGSGAPAVDEPPRYTSGTPAVDQADGHGPWDPPPFMYAGSRPLPDPLGRHAYTSAAPPDPDEPPAPRRTAALCRRCGGADATEERELTAGRCAICGEDGRRYCCPARPLPGTDGRFIDKELTA